MRDARTGQFVTVRQEHRKPMAKAKEIGEALSLSTTSVATLFAALTAAMARSRSDNLPLQFLVEVEPDGEPRIVEPFGNLTQSAPASAEALEMYAGEEAELTAALERARGRGRHAVAEIVGGPDMLSADDIAAHLETSRETINSKRKTHQLLALQGSTRGYRYPIWQIAEDGRPFDALPPLFAAFDGDAWAVYRLLTQHHAELDGLTGLDALRRKQDEAVLETARAIVQGTFA
ncbi:hypothetical protein ASE90_17200 [Sphingomonas sp. Leaf67]|uniref:hypothetical protein n=1 Tax=Sphingomonas sp. Leaf67 TaxID=1736230 RepID=UPI0006F1F88E|nr:hypothetical protein [Sphingomonas sp. Leaf67]KQN90818.1 hypothetical protein ASE90_17200 [Sphingomonas sp. Leaf67]